MEILFCKDKKCFGFVTFTVCSFLQLVNERKLTYIVNAYESTNNFMNPKRSRNVCKNKIIKKTIN